MPDANFDYKRYYDLESFLFQDVAKRFHSNGSIGAFDFFSIIIWKANRAKSKIARGLLTQATPGEDLEAVCHRFTGLLYRAASDEERFTIVASWKFRLPMASAILTILYPQSFTIYDYRVCEELKNFDKLANITNRKRLWEGYQAFIAAVQALQPDLSLRDKDRFLIGKSIAEQLQKDIKQWYQNNDL